MIIIKAAKLLVVHVPKTGGSTIHTALAPLLAESDVAITHNKLRNRERLEEVYNSKDLLIKHSTPIQFEQAVGPKQASEFRIMAFVRNPYARALSAYRYISKRATDGSVPHLKKSWPIASMSFEDFLRSPLAGQGGKPAAVPQTHWIPDPSKIAFLGRTETLNEDVARFATQIGHPIDKLENLTAQNVSGDQDAWKQMSNEAAGLIEALYREDFETFGYSHLR